MFILWACFGSHLINMSAPCCCLYSHPHPNTPRPKNWKPPRLKLKKKKKKKKRRRRLLTEATGWPPLAAALASTSQSKHRQFSILLFAETAPWHPCRRDANIKRAFVLNCFLTPQPGLGLLWLGLKKLFRRHCNRLKNFESQFGVKERQQGNDAGLLQVMVGSVGERGGLEF